MAIPGVAHSLAKLYRVLKDEKRFKIDAPNPLGEIEEN
jgi:hypothetical protein